MSITVLVLMLKAWVLLCLPAQAFAQTFAEYPMTNTWPNLSSACLAALNTTVTCSKLLPYSAEKNAPRLNAQNLTTLCTPTCLSSLNSARTGIQAACTQPGDVLPLDYGTYPATFLVDLFIYTYGLNCRRDAYTQQYCDVLFIQWLNQPSGKLTAAQECSDCILGISQMKLNSPFGYDAAFASAFTSLTSSCSKPEYAFTSPPPYLSTTSTGSSMPSASPTPELDPGCVTLYTIREGDTCNSIAASQNVSTFAVYGSSGLKDCSSLPTGIKLCLLGQCRRYLVQEGDTCDSIIAQSGVTVSPSMFVVWNPNINSVCTNLGHLVGTYICLSRPDGLLPPTIAVPSAAVLATGTVWPSSAPTTTSLLPTAPGTLAQCTNYTNYVDAIVYDSIYQAQSPFNLDVANRCYYVAAANGITLAQLLAWNPSLDANQSPCTFAAGYSYCVRYGNPTTPPTLGFCITPNPSIIVAGTVPSCSCYTQYNGYDSDYTDCSSLAADFGLTVAALQVLNPWLAGSLAACNTALFAGLAGEAHRQLCIRSGTSSTSTRNSSTSSTSKTSSSPSSTSTTAPPRTSTSTTSTRTLRSSSSSNPTSATTPPPTSTSTTTPGSVCISGTDTGNPNQSGLCSFSCHYGYCPPGPCVCTGYGTQVPPPPSTGITGYKLATLDDSYIGLCSYVYDHGYYPTGACTSHSDGSPE